MAEPPSRFLQGCYKFIFRFSTLLCTMKFFAAAAAVVALGCGSPALAFVQGGRSVVGSSNSRLVNSVGPSLSQNRATPHVTFSCGPVPLQFPTCALPGVDVRQDLVIGLVVEGEGFVVSFVFRSSPGKDRCYVLATAAASRVCVACVSARV